MSQSGSAPRGSDKPGSDGHRDGVGVGTGSFGGVGVAGAQGTVGTAGGETEGQGKGDSVGAGGVGVFRHFGKGRLGSDGSAGSVGATAAGGAWPTPVWHCGFGLALTWSQAGLPTRYWRSRGCPAASVWETGLTSS